MVPRLRASPRQARGEDAALTLQLAAGRICDRRNMLGWAFQCRPANGNAAISGTEWRSADEDIEC